MPREAAAALTYSEERQIRHLQSLGWTLMAISAELSRPRELVRQFMSSQAAPNSTTVAVAVNGNGDSGVATESVGEIQQAHQNAVGEVGYSDLETANGAPVASAKRGRGRPKGKVQPKLASKKVVRNPKQATVTTKSGTQLTLYQYQQFATREQGKLFIREFALAQGKRVVIDRGVSGGSNIVFVCKSETQCTFKVRILRSKKKGETAFYVTTLVADHGDKCTGKVSITKKQVMKEIRVASETKTTLTLTGSEAQNIVSKIQGGTANARVTTQASVMVKTALDDVMTETQRLQALLSQFQSQNPTSAMQIDAFNEDLVQRAFLMLPYSTQIQQHSARILGLECVDVTYSQAPAISMNSDSFEGTILELVAKDGNNESYTLAVALCRGGRTTENFAWFFNCCLSSGISLDVPIFCDRSAAILAAIESLPVSCLLIQCTQQLVTTMARALQLSQVSNDMRMLVQRAQTSDTYEEFESILSSIGMKNHAVADYLKRIDPNIWAKYCYLRKYPLYGSQSAALVESTSAPVDTERGPIALFQSFMERCMQAVYERKRHAKAWASSGQLLTGYAEHILRDHRNKAASCRVTPNDDESGSAYVWDTRSPVPKRRRVNISANSCSCPFADQFGLPCKHLVAALSFFNAGGGMWDLSKLCHPMYLARGYYDVYGHADAVSMPLEEELAWHMSVQVVPVGPTNRCSRCHAYGHNKRRCPSAGIA
uniref:SWIM-type domain-containing protein n=1 Tax=Globisporangium ultimum (strain ATCC 200006 / CBS 805.95 / DAOM BR144) TaxID=431595 RepID=K3WAA4_GLOUD